MARLIRDQPETLHKIVVFANQNGGVVPTARELGEIMNASERTTSARLNRLKKTLGKDLIQEGRTLRINYDTLCTEPETAAFLLALSGLAKTNESGRVLKSEAVKFSTLKSKDKTHEYLERLSAAGYLQNILVNQEEIRLTHKFRDQCDFIRLLANLKDKKEETVNA
jgi:hypothetical protein